MKKWLCKFWDDNLSVLKVSYERFYPQGKASLAQLYVAWARSNARLEDNLNNASSKICK